MSFGKMNSFIEIISSLPAKDAEGFAARRDTVLAFVRACRENRRGNEKWANMAAFSEASCLFCFRKIPGLEVTPEMLIVCEGARYNILSVEDVRGRRMYLEVLAKQVISSG